MFDTNHPFHAENLSVAAALNEHGYLPVTAAVPDGFAFVCEYNPEDFNPDAVHDHRHLQARVYQNLTTGEYTTNYRGTDNVSNVLHDDLSLVFGSLSDTSREFAEQVTAAVQARFPGAPITFTGHSLGGSLATYSGLLSGSSALVFDSAGLRDTELSPEAQANWGRIYNVDAKSFIGDFNTDPLPLSNILVLPATRGLFENHSMSSISDRVQNIKAGNAKGRQFKSPQERLFSAMSGGQVNFEAMNRRTDGKLEQVLRHMQKDTESKDRAATQYAAQSAYKELAHLGQHFDCPELVKISEVGHSLMKLNTSLASLPVFGGGDGNSMINGLTKQMSNLNPVLSSVTAVISILSVFGVGGKKKGDSALAQMTKAILDSIRRLHEDMIRYFQRIESVVQGNTILILRSIDQVSTRVAEIEALIYRAAKELHTKELLDVISQFKLDFNEEFELSAEQRREYTKTLVTWLDVHLHSPIQNALIREVTDVKSRVGILNDTHTSLLGMFPFILKQLQEIMPETIRVALGETKIETLPNVLLYLNTARIYSAVLYRYGSTDDCRPSLERARETLVEIRTLFKMISESEAIWERLWKQYQYYRFHVGKQIHLAFAHIDARSEGSLISAIKHAELRQELEMVASEMELRRLLMMHLAQLCGRDMDAVAALESKQQILDRPVSYYKQFRDQNLVEYAKQGHEAFEACLLNGADFNSWSGAFQVMHAAVWPADSKSKKRALDILHQLHQMGGLLQYDCGSKGPLAKTWWAHSMPIVVMNNHALFHLAFLAIARGYDYTMSEANGRGNSGGNPGDVGNLHWWCQKGGWDAILTRDLFNAIDGNQLFSKKELRDAYRYYNAFEAGFEVSSEGINHNCILWLAATLGKVEIFEHIPNFAPEINKSLPNIHFTAIMLATYCRSYDVVRYLLDKGAQITVAHSTEARSGYLPALSNDQTLGEALVDYMKTLDIADFDAKIGDKRYLEQSVRRCFIASQIRQKQGQATLPAASAAAAAGASSDPVIELAPCADNAFLTALDTAISDLSWAIMHFEQRALVQTLREALPNYSDSLEKNAQDLIENQQTLNQLTLRLSQILNTSRRYDDNAATRRLCQLFSQFEERMMEQVAAFRAADISYQSTYQPSSFQQNTPEPVVVFDQSIDDKLKELDAPMGEEFTLSKTLELLNEALVHVPENNQEAAAVIFLGQSGLGKSTIFNVLAHGTRYAKSYSDDGTALLKMEAGSEELAKTSETASSETVYPMIKDNFVDLPGYRDTRGTPWRITAAVSIAALARHFTNVNKLVLLTDPSSLRDSRFHNLRESFEVLGNMINRNPKLISRVMLIVNKNDSYTPAQVIARLKVLSKAKDISENAKCVLDGITEEQIMIINVPDDAFIDDFSRRISLGQQASQSPLPSFSQLNFENFHHDLENFKWFLKQMLGYRDELGAKTKAIKKQMFKDQITLVRELMSELDSLDDSVNQIINLSMSSNQVRQYHVELIAHLRSFLDRVLAYSMKQHGSLGDIEIAHTDNYLELQQAQHLLKTLETLFATISPLLPQFKIDLDCTFTQIEASVETDILDVAPDKKPAKRGGGYDGLLDVLKRISFPESPDLLFAEPVSERNMYNLIPYQPPYSVGDCLFVAVAVAFGNVTNEELQRLRGQVADYIRNDEQLSDIIRSNIEANDNALRRFGTTRLEYNTVEEYCNFMRQDQTWGTELEIIALSRMLGRPIAIITPDNKYDLVYGHDELGEAIFVNYVNQNHYAPLACPSEINPVDVVRRILRKDRQDGFSIGSSQFGFFAKKTDNENSTKPDSAASSAGAADEIAASDMSQDALRGQM